MRAFVGYGFAQGAVQLELAQGKDHRAKGAGGGATGRGRSAGWDARVRAFVGYGFAQGAVQLELTQGKDHRAKGAGGGAAGRGRSAANAARQK